MGMVAKFEERKFSEKWTLHMRAKTMCPGNMNEIMKAMTFNPTFMTVVTLFPEILTGIMKVATLITV